jgi:sugar lactone lactonase YvrE
MIIPAKCRQLHAARAVLGEGPIHDPRDGLIWWTDIKGKRLHAFDLDGGRAQSWELPSRLGSVVVPDGRWGAPSTAPRTFLCAGDEGFAWLKVEGDQAQISPIVHPERHLPQNRFNDGVLGPDGRYYAGTMDDTETHDWGTLYALAPDGVIRVIDTDYRVPNGPVFSPDGRFMYHTDSAKQRIYRFGIGAGGEFGPRELFHEFSAGEGFPDGMACDSEGWLFVAMWDGFGLCALTPDGCKAGHIEMPIARPTSCAFVPGRGRRLVVTSSSIGQEPDDMLAGGLFEIELV